MKKYNFHTSIFTSEFPFTLSSELEVKNPFSGNPVFPQFKTIFKSIITCYNDTEGRPQEINMTKKKEKDQEMNNSLPLIIMKLLNEVPRGSSTVVFF
jgi:hypothetical protein